MWGGFVFWCLNEKKIINMKWKMWFLILYIVIFFEFLIDLVKLIYLYNISFYFYKYV